MSMLSKFGAFFQRSLAKRPVLTNTCVYATFYTLAEMSQQTFNKFHTPEKPDYDFKAAARIITVGSCLYAPVLTKWYNLLDRKLPGAAPKTVVKKVFSDQLIMTPILLAIFFTLMGIFEGREDIFSELKAKYRTAFIANQCFWLPAQSFNFLLVPPQMRVVYVASMSFLWINVLCFIKRQNLDEGKISKDEFERLLASTI